jgi:hypothetical protein
MGAVRELVEASIGSSEADYAEGVGHLTGCARMSGSGGAGVRVMNGVSKGGRVDTRCWSWSGGDLALALGGGGGRGRGG